MQTIKKPWIWVAFVALLLLGSLLFLIFGGLDTEQSKVCILQNGQCLYEIDLTEVKEPYEIELRSEDGGINLIRVEPNRICISEANCPDQICVGEGWLEGNRTPIVCLPNQTVIMYIGD